KIPDVVRGDIMCEVGGANIGERGLHELLGRYGAARTHLHVSAFLDACERSMREKIRTIPDGVYKGAKAIDDDVASDDALTIGVTVTVKDDEIEFDFSESDPQSPRYMNSSDAFTRSMATLTLFWILEHHESNHGSLRPFSFVNPMGTCVNPQFPHSSVLATCNIAEAIQEAVQRALAPAVPERTAAPSTNLLFPMIAYIHPDKKRLDVNLDFFFRCTPSGGTLGFDGWEQGGPAQEMGMGRCPDPEITELTHPVRIHRFEQEIDSAGAGQYRGGNGHVYRVQHFAPSLKAVVFGSGTKEHAVPTGFFGGHSPSPSRMVIERADGDIEELRPNGFFEVRPGDVLELRSMGGPGYGNPLERDPELVARDVRDGYLSPDKAERAYGVAVNGRGEVDAAATNDTRARMTAAE
ncbi:MAG: hydantoinase B/oxoprolinase family protein, partial [Rhodospirillales bacterium]|nr:hydantoinase B/oxoprolinase family protein [Rhodospirillales bacterium]